MANQLRFRIGRITAVDADNAIWILNVRWSITKAVIISDTG